MNYVMYTATPYANFLNESTEESLYPRNFIWTLKTSYNIVTVEGAVASRVFFHLKAEAVRMGE